MARLTREELQGLTKDQIIEKATAKRSVTRKIKIDDKNVVANVENVATHRFNAMISAMRAFSNCFTDKYDWKSKSGSLETVEKHLNNIHALLSKRIADAKAGKTVSASEKVEIQL